MLHDGHQGVVKMKCLARSYVWWPGLDRDVDNVARSCAPSIKIKSNPRPVPLHPWIWPRSPWCVCVCVYESLIWVFVSGTDYLFD